MEPGTFLEDVVNVVLYEKQNVEQYQKKLLQNLTIVITAIKIKNSNEIIFTGQSYLEDGYAGIVTQG